MIPFLSALRRKAGHLLEDPVLRRWLVERALGARPRPPTFQPHRPPYLDHLLPLEPEKPDPSLPFTPLKTEPWSGSFILPLPGENVIVDENNPEALFERAFADTERLLAVHRFAWITGRTETIGPTQVDLLWRTWCVRHGTPTGGWPWHPYTAAERAINIIRYARRFGLPGDSDETLAILARHAPVIAGALEYFGDHHTSNHLAANGRGLLVLGLELGLPRAAEMGAAIMTSEASRIFRPSGVLRENSSHYHLLLARNYHLAAETAAHHGHPAAPVLRKIAIDARAVVPLLLLPGGLPLIGDISPDRMPSLLLEDLGVPDDGVVADAVALCRDGWLRMNSGSWSGLWHVDPEGWPHMPGHGHQDAGGFEVHWRDLPLFVDPGRGAYGDSGDAALYRSGAVHNTLLVDGHDPYPPNRPYYDAAFRRAVAGPPPVLETLDDGVRLSHEGFSRLKGVGALGRRWRFGADGFVLEDHLAGHGRRTVTRQLVTPFPVTDGDGGAIIDAGGVRFRVLGDGRPKLLPAVRWTAYGEGTPAVAIVFADVVPLPWRGRIAVEEL